MEPLVTYRGAIYPWHCDHIGHMNNMWYAGKFDEASWTLLLRIGVTPAYMRAADRGMAAVEQAISFKRELMAGDVVEVRSQILEVRPKVIRFVHAMHNAETDVLAATCAITGVHMDTQARRSCPFPDPVRQAAEGFAALALAA